MTGIYLTRCSVMTEAETLKGAEVVLKTLYNRNPLLRVAQTLFSTSIEHEEINEKEIEENEEKGE